MSKGKMHMGQHPGDTRFELLFIPSQWICVDVPCFSQHPHVTIRIDYGQPANSPELWYPEFLLGFSHTDIADHLRGSLRPLTPLEVELIPHDPRPPP